MADTTHYAVALFGQRQTDWRECRLEAVADAVAASLASWDDWHRPRFYLSAGVTIITRQAKP